MLNIRHSGNDFPNFKLFEFKVLSLTVDFSDRINTFPIGQQNDTSTHPSVKEFSEGGFFSARPPQDTTHTDTVTCFYWSVFSKLKKTFKTSISIFVNLSLAELHWLAGTQTTTFGSSMPGRATCVAF